MSITERLRARKVANVIEVEGDTPRIRGQMPDALCIEAADEIDRMKAELVTAKRRADASQMRMVEAEDDNYHGSKAAVFVNALKDRITSLEADLREEQDRRQAMRTEWGAEVAALTERINALRSDRDCEKRLRKDAEDAEDRALGRAAELEAELDRAEQWNRDRS